MNGSGNNILLFTPGFSDNNRVPEILRSGGYNVTEVDTLPELLRTLGLQDYDLAVFGIFSGRDNITDLSATIRSICRVPVLFIIPADSDSGYVDRVKSCADDFIVSPIREEELIMRTDLVLSCQSRTSRGRRRDRFPIGSMTFDYKNQILHTSDGDKNLTLTEARLLHLLCLHRNNILPRELALEIIWGENDYFKARSMDVYVAKLRKLMNGDKSVSISNIHKVGFRLNIKEDNDGKRKIN
jgi:DNA-binding response OmpR family regulator